MATFRYDYPIKPPTLQTQPSASLPPVPPPTPSASGMTTTTHPWFYEHPPPLSPETVTTYPTSSDSGSPWSVGSHRSSSSSSPQGHYPVDDAPTHPTTGSVGPHSPYYQDDATTSRALRLLQQATQLPCDDHHHDNDHHTHTGDRTTTTRSLTTRQAAQQHALQKQQQHEEASHTTPPGPRPKLYVPTPLEQMATTSRRRKPLTPDDVRDPETIAGMKYATQWEAEQKAQAKTKRLLKFLDTQIT